MRIKQSPTLCSGSPPSFARKHLKGSLSFHNSTVRGGLASFLFADGAVWLFQGRVLNFSPLINTFGLWPFNLFPAPIYRVLIIKDNKSKPTKNHALKQSTEERVALILLD